MIWYNSCVIDVAKGTIYHNISWRTKGIMARKAREKSEIGIYMVNIKSVGEVEFDTEDMVNFLNILYKNDTFLLSYTMLNNSFLFVIKEDDRTIDTIIRKAVIKFVRKYNKAHNREGKVFAGRFASYASHTMQDVWKFIGNVHTMARFHTDSLSSNKDYFENKYIRSEYSLRFFDSRADFYNTCSTNADLENNLKLSDEEIANYIVNTFRIQPHNISALPDSIIENTIVDVFKVTKASARQLARITSLPLRMLWGVAKKLKPIVVKGKVKNESKPR